MEPSTSSNDGSKPSRRVLYNKKQVLDLLLGDSSEDEALYEDSGSDYEESRTRSSSSSESETGGSRSRSINETLKAGKKRQIPANRVSSKSRSRSSSKKQKTSGKTKNCREGNDNQSRSRHNPSDDDISNHTSDIAFAPYKFSNSNHASLHRHISPTSPTLVI